MESELLGIGQLAAVSGLSISALRFYDAAEVLKPVSVDPHSGYRRYHPDQQAPARVLARLRRVGMPLVEIRQLLAAPAAATAILDRHLRRLENGLADARRELSAVHTLLTTEENTMYVITLPATALAAGLAAVRHAVGSDPELPVLHGVLLDVIDGRVRLTATDRYRLASCRLSATTPLDPALSVIAPVDLVDEALALLTRSSQDAVISCTPNRIDISTDAGTISGAPITLAFPDVDRALRERDTRRPVTVHGDALRTAIRRGGTRPMTRDQDGQTYPVTVLAVSESGAVSVLDAETTPGPDDIGVSQEFLLQALDASDREQLTLELDGPIGPLAIRGDDQLCVVMPTRLH